jgi:hypothetical protein
MTQAELDQKLNDTLAELMKCSNAVVILLDVDGIVDDLDAVVRSGGPRMTRAGLALYYERLVSRRAVEATDGPVST